MMTNENVDRVFLCEGIRREWQRVVKADVGLSYQLDGEFDEMTLTFGDEEVGCYRPTEEMLEALRRLDEDERLGLAICEIERFAI